MKTIVIKDIFGKEIFKHKCANNTTKKTVLAALLAGADLSCADLTGANLSRANLTGANLTGAYLTGAYLTGVNFNEGTSMFLPQCPDGAFIGWKKAKNKIVKMQICEDSMRSSATSLKCRCSKAKVLEIQELDGTKSTVNKVASDYDKNFIYKIGEVVEVADFDENRWEECSSGIHFFISREMAVKYS